MDIAAGYSGEESMRSHHMDQSAPASPLTPSVNEQFDPPGTVFNPRAKGSSVTQLELALAELLLAARRALEDERDAAEQSIQRAAALLDIQLPATEVRTTRDSLRDSEPSRERGGLAPWQIRKVSTHILCNLGRTITNQELAAIARISIFHFVRYFRRSFGESPRRYILRLKMERAQGLMLATHDSLACIALDCGFGDQAHFGKLFHQFTGESPGAWRRARTMRPCAGRNLRSSSFSSD